MLIFELVRLRASFFIGIFFVLLPSLSFASPEACFEAASKDRVIKWANYLKVPLCRKAKSTAPYECFRYAYTDSEDFYLGSSTALILCQGATEVKTPYACFLNAISELRGEVKYIHAVKFCSAATSVEKPLRCFLRAKKNYELNNDQAAELCAL